MEEDPAALSASMFVETVIKSYAEKRAAQYDDDVPRVLEVLDANRPALSLDFRRQRALVELTLDAAWGPLYERLEEMLQISTEMINLNGETIRNDSDPDVENFIDDLFTELESLSEPEQQKFMAGIAGKADGPSTEYVLEVGTSIDLLDAHWVNIAALQDLVEEAYGAEITEDDQLVLAQLHELQHQGLAALHARALLTVSEILHCSRGGFHAAAEARWRTLHELAVATTLLCDHPELAPRWHAAASVEQADDAEAFEKYCEALGQDPIEANELLAIQRNAAVLREHFGKIIAKPYGWAHPVVLESTYAQAVAVAGLEHYKPYYRAGNHVIHAGPRAGQLNVRTTDDGSEEFKSGPSVDGHPGELLHNTAIAFLQINSAVIVAFRGAGGLRVMSALRVLERRVTQLADVVENCESAALKLRLRLYEFGDEGEEFKGPVTSPPP